MENVQKRILDTACRLFNDQGIANVGVDRIVRESSVAKMSLYNHFGSKDALVAAFLQQAHITWRDWFAERVGELRHDRLPIVAFFDALDSWLHLQHFRGCPFINSVVELANPQHPGATVAEMHRAYVRTYLGDLLRESHLPGDEASVESLLILMDGAIVGTLMGRTDAAILAKRAALSLFHVGGEEGASPS